MKSTNITSHRTALTQMRRAELNGHASAIVWFTGLSGAGKSTLAYAVEEQLHESGCKTFVLDGDNVRHGLCGDLGFSAQDRHENLRRVGEVAKLFVEAGTIVLAAFISPFEADRARLRAMADQVDFIEVYCNCPLTVCEQRDTKGIYSKARSGAIGDFTGISSPYEVPTAPELIFNTDVMSLDTCVEAVIALLRERRVLPTVFVASCEGGA